MKKILLAYCFSIGFTSFSQQNLSFTSLTPAFTKSTPETLVDSATEISTERKYFSFIGIGNLNNESLEKLNGGGKLAVGFAPDINSKVFPSSYFLSFNKNATNNDSILVSTLVFPETGNHSFLATAFWDFKKDGNDTLYGTTGLFFEFATKRISVEDTTDSKEANFGFNTLHYTGGFRYIYQLSKDVNHQKYKAALGFHAFVSNTNIPDEDNTALESIIKGKAEKNSFWSAGVKIGVQINGFQIFADFRHVFGDEEKLPIKDLKGFNSNIGVSFNAEIFSL
jgi:hypothetical protein